MSPRRRKKPRRIRGDRAWVLLRREDGAELVITYAEWNALFAGAMASGWAPEGTWQSVGRGEARRLARLLDELEPAPETASPTRLPPRHVVDFLHGGGFTAMHIGGRPA